MVRSGLRVLMVAPQPFFRPRGTPFSVLHRIRALRALGHDVDLVTYPFGETPDVPGLTVRRTARPPFVKDVAIGPSVAKLLLDVPLFAEAVRRARAGGYDVVHTHEEAGFLGAWLRDRTGIPHLYDMHSSLPQQFANFGRYQWPAVVALFRRLEAYTLARSDAVIAICPDLERRVREHGYGGPLAMIENVLGFEDPPPDEARVRALREGLDLGGRPLVVYTGTFEPYQGLDVLVDAAARLRDRPEAPAILLVGGTPGQARALEGRARAAGAGALLRFVPPVPPREVPVWLAAADALVTCRTRGTNTPLKIYEYLRAGRPIVATRIHSHTQALDAESAELVEPTPEGVAAGLTRVLGDPLRAARLAQGARRLAETRFSPDGYMQRLEDLLAGLPRRRAALQPLGA